MTTTTTDRTKYRCETVRSESEHSICGVPGRRSNLVRHARDEPNQRIRKQQWISERRTIPGTNGEMLQVKIRHDDELLNGHESFAITGDIYDKRGRDIGGGCCHETIESTFPELAPLIKWHLCSTDGPMHYPANVLYLAGDRDCWGLRKGEVRQIRNGKTGKLCWKASKSTLDNRIVDADECPTDTEIIKFEPWTRVGEGKERELDSARRSAIWPEATDDELSSETEVLRGLLEARLPALLRDFRFAVESIGFEFE